MPLLGGVRVQPRLDLGNWNELPVASSCADQFDLAEPIKPAGQAHDLAFMAEGRVDEAGWAKQRTASHRFSRAPSDAPA